MLCPPYSDLQALLSTSNPVVIIMHHRPDADALGASLALGRYLKKKGQQVHIISPSTYPGFLHWMALKQELMIYSATTKYQIHALIQNAGLIFCIDFSSLCRIQELGPVVEQAGGKKIMIDHHLNPSHFADLIFWDAKACASSALVYELIASLGDQAHIDPSMASCLYAGILTDTGSFRHANTCARVHHIAAHLIDLGANITKVNRHLYANNSIHRLKFLGFALTHRLMVLPEYRVAFFVIKREDFKNFHLKIGDTEGLVDYALSLQGMVVGALIAEKEDCIRLSLRSFGAVNVNELAHQYFQGGGHKNAAAGKSYGSLEDTVEQFKAVIYTCLEKRAEIAANHL